MFRAIVLCLVWWSLWALPAAGHEWYSELKVPGAQEDCCGEKDCQPFPHRFTDPAEENMELLINGRWWPVSPDIVLELGSPDGLAHACCYYAGGVMQGCEARPEPVFRCVIRPRGSV